MKTITKLLYIEVDEEVTDLVDRLRTLQDEAAVTFVVPDRARALQSPMSFRLLKRYAEAYGKHVNLVSPDPRLQALALESGFSAYPSLEAYDAGSEVHRAADAEPAPVSAAPVAVAAAVAAPPAVETVTRTRTADVVSAPARIRPAQPPPGGGRALPPRDLRPFYAAGAGIVGVLAVVFLALFVPTADVRITVTGTLLKTDMQLIGMQNPVAGTVDHFPTQVITSTASQTLQGSATGQKQIPATTASGQAVFTLHCMDPTCLGANLPAGLTVKTADNKEFRVPNGKGTAIYGRNGSATLPVVAVNTGASSNVAAKTVTIIEGNDHPDELTVTNPQAMAGGADQRVATVIQQSDLDVVKASLATQLNPKVQDDLTSQAKGKHLVPADQPKVDVTTDHQLGEETSTFNLTMTVSATGVVFDNAVVTRLLQDALKAKVPYGSELTGDQAKITFDVAQATNDGNVTLNGHASGYTVIVFSQPAIRAHIKGHSPSSARAFLEGLPNVVDVSLVQNPIGFPWLPLFSSHIRIQIQEVTGTAAS